MTLIKNNRAVFLHLWENHCSVVLCDKSLYFVSGLGTPKFGVPSSFHWITCTRA